MKRGREEVTSGGSHKRQASANGRGEVSESPGPLPSQAAGQQQRLTTDDALTYLKAVKEKFKDDKAKYEDFLDCMKDFKAQRLNTAGVIVRVKRLFAGHRELILGFNTFLPKGYEIVMPEEPVKKQPVEFDQAINYVNKIKTRFANNEHVYKSFLEILNMYRKGNKTIQEVYSEVAELFCDHADLLQQFTFFLPDHSHANGQPPRVLQARPGVRVPVSSVVQQNRTNVADKVDKKPIGGEGLGGKDSERVVKVERDDKKNVEKIKDKDKGKEKGRDKPEERLEKVKEEKILEEREDREKDVDVENDADNGVRPTKRSSARRADVLIKNQAEGNAVAGTSAGPAASEEKKPAKAGSTQPHATKEPGFFERLKAKLKNRDTYQEFSKVVYMYTQGIINKAEFHNLGKDVLQKNPELLEDFDEFVAGAAPDLLEQAAAAIGNRKFDVGETSALKKKDAEVLKEAERPREREKDKATGLQQKDQPHKIVGTKENKYLYKPVSELDLSSSEQCTASYRLLPKLYPRMTSTHRTDLGTKVLNDNWVSVTSGSEDYSFKFMRKNQYEESLFRCEDDRFELDMLLESTAVTAKKVGELVDNLHREKGADGKPAAAPTKLEDLSAINLRCIERIYGDHGLDIQELLRKNPAVALPVILQRLRQKHEEWLKCRDEMNKVWKEVYAKNYHKSLDHRSFYFKQQDKKTLSGKGLLAEVKDLNEKKKRDDDAVLISTAAGNRRHLIPDITLEYSDPAIHDNMFKIVKFSAEEVCTSAEQSKKVMKLWTDFLEPFLGVAGRSSGSDDAEETNKAVHRDDDAQQRTEAAVPAGERPAIGQVARSGSTSAFPSMDIPPPPPGDCPVPEVAPTANGDAPPVQEAGQTAAKFGAAAGEAAEPPARDGNDRTAAAAPHTTAAVQNEEATGEAQPSGGAEAMQVDGSEAGAPPAAAVGETSGDGGEAQPDAAGPSSADRNKAEARDSPPSGREEGELSPSPETEEQRQAPPRRSRGNGGERKAMANGVGFHRGGKGRGHHGHRERAERDSAHGNHHRGREGAEEGGDSGPSGRSSCVESDTNSENENEHDDEHDDHEEEEDEEHDNGEHLEKGESEGEADGGDDVDDGDDRTSSASLDGRFSRCKPLAAHPASMIRGAVSQQPDAAKVLYANDIFYILFRLHQKLYERVSAAKTHSRAQHDKWKNRGEDDGTDPYAKFMDLLFSLLDGQIENSRFEDDCRTLIGTQSYVLFTLDKLIYKLVKQLQAAVSDDNTNKLLDLHKTERNRPHANFVDSVYHANACVVHPDEAIYRLEHKDAEDGTSKLSIQLMEGPEKLEVPAAVMDPSFADYLHQYVNSIPDPIPDRHHVFLHRNMTKAGQTEGTEGGEEAGKRKDEDKIFVHNSLECKIATNTSKVSYVLDTEDVFFRQKRKRVSGSNANGEQRKKMQRASIFHAWVSSRVGIAVGDS